MADKKEFEQLKLNNVSVRWAKVIHPGKAYDASHPDEWSVNMYVSDEDREALMARGVNPKEDKDGVEYFIAKRAVRSRSGADVKPPAVMDRRRAPFTEEIGNGSVCNIAVTVIPWQKSATQKGVKLYLQALQVVTHVARAGAADEMFDDIPDADMM